jgi:oligoribonuclease
MFKYVSCDIETTSLDPQTGQILEIGAVIEDIENPLPLAKLPVFHTYVIHKEIRGDAFALSMNSVILRKIANWRSDESGANYTDPEQVGARMKSFFEKHSIDPERVTAAGKNFASFDLQFLKNLPFFTNCVRFNHRSIDPAILYWRKGDVKLPDTKLCYERAGIQKEVAHTAVDDALGVVELIRRNPLGVLCG